jgi:hypothetical protein
VPGAVSLGTVPQAQGGGQAPYPARSAGQHPELYPHLRRQVARRQRDDRIAFEAGCFQVIDRGYVDFARLYRLHLALAFFVIRAKSNLPYRRVYSHAIDKATGLRCDQTIVLTGLKTAGSYPIQLRRGKFYDAERDKLFVFLTNSFALPALTIAQLCRCRWQVELFFKWIKQHLRIEAFFGTSENAVKTPVWIAVSA